MKSLHQINIENYHAAIENMHHGHNMHVMHRNWHQNNPDPSTPSVQDPNWGVNLIFGTNFLQMHHEMVKAKSADPHHHMMHTSVAEWYSDQGLSLPSLWNPLDIIPEELGYEPDPSAYPDEIRNTIEQYANQLGQSIEAFLTRTSDNPSFELPKYFTRAGVSDPVDADPLTGAMRLSDFVNTNQLGCSLVFPHNEWHGAIGGAMTTTWTAIADPIFYLGVHWHVDRVFDEFKLIEQERQLHSFDFEIMSEKALDPRTLTRNAREFTEQEKSRIELFIKASEAIKGPPLNR